METQNINWGNGGFLLLYHASLVFLLPLYFFNYDSTLGLWLSAFVLFYLGGLGITMGFHRLFAHKSYEASTPVQVALLLMGISAAQGSVLQWSFDHRWHHQYVDKEKDPYNINKGFMYAHIFWLLTKGAPIDPKVVPDLMKNKLVMFQHKHHILCQFIVNGSITVFLGLIFNDMLGAFIITWLLRMFVIHHFTFFINSLAHYWGRQPFSTKHSARDSYLLSLFTFGEGYHNFHHTFAADYRNGVHWYQYDPSKWLIWALSKVGLTKNLRRMDSYMVKYKMLQFQKAQMLEKLKHNVYVKREVLERRIEDLAQAYYEKSTRMRQLYEAKKQAKQQRAMAKYHSFKREMKILRASLKSDWRQWKELNRGVLQLHPNLV